jgi:tRNA pseudouridine55 synthase
MDGLLLVDKPTGWTSHDVVAKARSILKNAAGHKVKVGHTGTLDPLATGLLVLTVGTYCKEAQQFTKLDKSYKVTMKLGENSSTGDEEGEKIKISTHEPSLDDVKQTAEQFIGEISQIPPAYSAIKINGKRAYELAREGREVIIEPRTVTVYSIAELDYSYPYIRFTAEVSSGTYIRSLVQDMGIKLGTGAYMSDLRRTRVGKFDLASATTPDQISQAKLVIA